MDIFTRFKQALKIREVIVDNNVFQLHYRVTALMLLCCAGLVASKQHFGDPIDCITRDDVPNKIMDTYCWIHSTFTLPAACNKTVGVEVAHPCVDKSSAVHQEERIYHKYYQWVYFVLFFQAAFFYAPHFAWKSCESRLLSQLTEDLRDPLFKKEEKVGKAKCVVRYLRRHRSLHQRYFYMFTLFEAINLLNVLAQIYVVDQFLGGTFTTYGLDVIQWAQLEQDDRMDPMVRVFPRMTKCSFHRFGSSGDVQKYDALCILPLNIINEKIYIFMWFWFVFLALVTSCWLIYRAFTFFKPQLRYEVLRRRASLASGYSLRFVLRQSKSGDWFLLTMMCKNMDSQWFRYIIARLAWSLKKKAEKRRLRNGAGANGSGQNNRNRFGPLRAQKANLDEASKELMLAGQEHEQSEDDDSQDLSESARSSSESESEHEQRDDDRQQLTSVKVDGGGGGAPASEKV